MRGFNKDGGGGGQSGRWVYEDLERQQPELQLQRHATPTSRRQRRSAAAATPSTSATTTTTTMTTTDIRKSYIKRAGSRERPALGGGAPAEWMEGKESLLFPAAAPPPERDPTRQASPPRAAPGLPPDYDAWRKQASDWTRLRTASSAAVTATSAAAPAALSSSSSSSSSTTTAGRALGLGLGRRNVLADIMGTGSGIGAAVDLGDGVFAGGAGVPPRTSAVQPDYAPTADTRPYHSRRTDGLTVFRDEESTVASSLSQQQLLKKKHHRRLAARAEAAGASHSATGGGGGGGAADHHHHHHPHHKSHRSKDKASGGGRVGGLSSPDRAKEKIRSFVRSGDVRAMAAYVPHRDLASPSSHASETRTSGWHTTSPHGSDHEEFANTSRASADASDCCGGEEACPAPHPSDPHGANSTTRRDPSPRRDARERVGIRPPALDPPPSDALTNRRHGNSGGGGGFGIGPRGDAYDDQALYRKQMLLVDDVWGATAEPPRRERAGRRELRDERRPRADHPPEVLMLGRSRRKREGGRGKREANAAAAATTTIAKASGHNEPDSERTLRHASLSDGADSGRRDSRSPEPGRRGREDESFGRERGRHGRVRRLDGDDAPEPCSPSIAPDRSAQSYRPDLEGRHGQLCVASNTDDSHGLAGRHGCDAPMAYPVQSAKNRITTQARLKNRGGSFSDEPTPKQRDPLGYYDDEELRTNDKGVVIGTFGIEGQHTVGDLLQDQDEDESESDSQSPTTVLLTPTPQHDTAKVCSGTHGEDIARIRHDTKEPHPLSPPNVYRSNHATARNKNADCGVAGSYAPFSPGSTSDAMAAGPSPKPLHSTFPRIPPPSRHVVGGSQRQRRRRDDTVRERRLQMNRKRAQDLAALASPCDELRPDNRSKGTSTILGRLYVDDLDRSAHQSRSFPVENVHVENSSDGVPSSQAVAGASSMGEERRGTKLFRHPREEEQDFVITVPLKNHVAHAHGEIHERREWRTTSPPKQRAAGPEFGFIQAVAAVVIQTFVRRFLATCAATRRYAAVFTIQAFLRHCLEQKKRAMTKEAAAKVAAVEEERDVAAILIQAIFRGWWVRDCLAVDHYCATLLQKIIRGYLRRLDYEFDLFCIVVAQSAVRRQMALREAYERFLSIMLIQAAWRGYVVRKSMRRLREARRREVAAVRIQSIWRSYDAQMNFMHRLADILIVQSVARRWITMKLVVPYLLAQRQHEFSVGSDFSVNSSELSDSSIFADQMESRKIMKRITESRRANPLLNMWKQWETQGKKGPVSRTAKANIRFGAVPLGKAERVSLKERPNSSTF